MKTLTAIAFLLLMVTAIYAHPDKRYAEKHPLTKEQHKWFDTIKSDKGLCCSDIDGTVLSDMDWESKDGHYRVFIANEWRDVPDDAVVKGPNMYGPTMVWPINIWNPQGGMRIEIRCFIPGQMG